MSSEATAALEPSKDGTDGNDKAAAPGHADGGAPETERPGSGDTGAPVALSGRVGASGDVDALGKQGSGDKSQYADVPRPDNASGGTDSTAPRGSGPTDPAIPSSDRQGPAPAAARSLESEHVGDTRSQAQPVVAVGQPGAAGLVAGESRLAAPTAGEHSTAGAQKGEQDAGEKAAADHGAPQTAAHGSGRDPEFSQRVNQNIADSLEGRTAERDGGDEHEDGEPASHGSGQPVTPVALLTPHAGAVAHAEQSPSNADSKAGLGQDMSKAASITERAAVAAELLAGNRDQSTTPRDTERPIDVRVPTPEEARALAAHVISLLGEPSVRSALFAGQVAFVVEAAGPQSPLHTALAVAERALDQGGSAAVHGLTGVSVERARTLIAGGRQVAGEVHSTARHLQTQLASIRAGVEAHIRASYADMVSGYVRQFVSSESGDPVLLTTVAPPMSPLILAGQVMHTAHVPSVCGIPARALVRAPGPLGALARDAIRSSDEERRRWAVETHALGGGARGAALASVLEANAINPIYQVVVHGHAIVDAGRAGDWNAVADHLIPFGLNVYSTVDLLRSATGGHASPAQSGERAPRLSVEVPARDTGLRQPAVPSSTELPRPPGTPPAHTALQGGDPTAPPRAGGLPSPAVELTGAPPPAPVAAHSPPPPAAPAPSPPGGT
ncbi:MAG: hypothetical protein M3042_04770, partial [Actinomycetota bacterium]|nr:hypothetical protein [Actinomycetota bacterium]